MALPLPPTQASSGVRPAVRSGSDETLRVANVSLTRCRFRSGRPIGRSGHGIGGQLDAAWMELVSVNVVDQRRSRERGVKNTRVYAGDCQADRVAAAKDERRREQVEHNFGNLTGHEWACISAMVAAEWNGVAFERRRAQLAMDQS